MTRPSPFMSNALKLYFPPRPTFVSSPPEINPPEPRFVIPPARWTLARSSFTSFIAIRNYSTDVIIYFRKPSADIVGDVIRPLRGTRFIIHEGTRGNIHTRLTR